MRSQVLHTVWCHWWGCKENLTWITLESERFGCLGMLIIMVTTVFSLPKKTDRIMSLIGIVSRYVSRSCQSMHQLTQRPTVEWCNNWYSIKCQSRSRVDTQSICGWTSISADMLTDTSTDYWLTCWSSVSHGSIECQSIYQSTQWVTYYWLRVPTRYMIQMVSSNEAASPGSSSGKQLDFWPKTWE